MQGGGLETAFRPLSLAACDGPFAIGCAPRYRRAMRRLFFPIVLLALAGCSKADNEPGPGGVSMGEARALDEAAAMIEQRRPPAEAVQAPSEAASVSPSPAGTPP